ncbi:hypothetical protein DPMN_011689 [Dreissena polymorpha]|uniref:MAM domain-containing protein n=1 Tax=Dreissena polymorpha TaxID=45954 RepID=A0A9D4S0J3_DREPO|nr:hypothetical protein DPMN_011689 [Dreissena polymorpha]
MGFVRAWLIISIFILSASGAVDCNFDQGLCTWTQDKGDNFDWTLNRGPTPTTLTGPSADHTGSMWLT